MRDASITDGEQAPRRRRIAEAAAAAVVLVVLVGAIFAWTKFQDYLNGPDASDPSCSWSAHIQHANSAQDGLIRCYLRAVAHHSADELQAVVRGHDDNGPTGFDSADFAHTADARGGPATATVTGNADDTADADIAIRYADGATDDHEIHLANPASATSWRFWDVGVYPPDPDAPPTVSFP